MCGQAIRTGSSNQVDLPLEAQTATISAITMADNANADDLDLPPIPTQMSLEELADGGLDDDPSSSSSKPERVQGQGGPEVCR